MLALLGGQERTAAEFERLLASASFQIVRVVPTSRRGAASSKRSLASAVRVKRADSPGMLLPGSVEQL